MKKLILVGLCFSFSISAFASLSHEILCQVRSEQGVQEFNGVTVELTLTEELQALASAPLMLGTTGLDQDDLYYLPLRLDGSINLAKSLIFTVIEDGGADKLPNKYDQYIYDGVKIEIRAEKSDAISPASFKFTKQNGKVILRNGSCNVVTQGSAVVD